MLIPILYKVFLIFKLWLWKILGLAIFWVLLDVPRRSPSQFKWIINILRHRKIR